MSSRYTNQRGLGMIEVLVSLVLLAVAVLGFVSLQMRAVQSTDESLKRTQAMSVIRGLAESMRSNPRELDTYEEVIKDPSKAKNGVTEVSCQDLDGGYTTTLNKKDGTTAEFDTSCTSKHIAAKQAIAVLKEAKRFDVDLSIITCPGTEVTVNKPTTTTSAHDRSLYQLQKLQELKCIIAAWEDTTATVGSTETDCADASGVYKTNATCIMVEAY